MKLHKDSHLDHGLNQTVIDYFLEKFTSRKCFFNETIELPQNMLVSCGLWGPVMGDEIITEDMVTYDKRGNRSGNSRLIDRLPRMTRTLTVIAGPHEGQDCVLYTAFGGPSAPKESWELEVGSDEWHQSIDFWSMHALSK